ncbi:MAG TPA: hypothetical protein VJZ94_02610, partial [Candidatus Paceibacterota bacterium]|nr:hypothetical protein [Candidatus Paceibacterota bacterium]
MLIYSLSPTLSREGRGSSCIPGGVDVEVCTPFDKLRANGSFMVSVTPTTPDYPDQKTCAPTRTAP